MPSVKAVEETVGGADGSGIFTHPLPESWKVIPLEKATVPTPQVDPVKRPDWKFKYVDVSAVSNESLDITGFAEYKGPDAPGRARKAIQAGDVIFATVRPSLKRVAIVPSELDGQVCSTAFCVIRANPKIADTSFLFFAVSNDDFVKRVAANERGVSYPAVTDKVVLREIIALPPLQEQEAIARVLSAIRAAEKGSREVVDAAREVKKTLMVSLLGRPTNTPASQPPQARDVEDQWKQVRLGDVITSRREAVDPESEPGLPYVGLEHIDSGQLVLTRWGKAADVRSQKNRFFRNDILYGKLRPYLDKAVLAAVEGFCSTDILVLEPSETVVPEFISQIFHTSEFVSFANSTTTGVNHPRTSWGAIKEFTFRLPPSSEQEKIATYLETLDRKMFAEKNRLTSLRDLYETVLHELLTGRIRLVPQEAERHA